MSLDDPVLTTPPWPAPPASIDEPQQRCACSTCAAELAALRQCVAEWRRLFEKAEQRAGDAEQRLREAGIDTGSGSDTGVAGDGDAIGRGKAC